MAAGSGSPCGACKFLRRKCASDCIFAPYFCSEQGPARFAAIHKVFGASNVSKLLLHVPLPDRCEAVFTIAYEAQARIRDPVYGCVAHIFALQQQVAYLQAQLIQVKAQLAHNLAAAGSKSLENHWPSRTAGPVFGGGGDWSPQVTYPAYVHSLTPHNSLEFLEQSSDGMMMQMQDMLDRDDLSFQPCAKKRLSTNDLGELQALALRMMRN
ncbi:LOB domain-containing protein 16-like [Macadamia integrifolia]|uniref:LOB domain-containing protein 16-like n=1 Tax=Macadamia integrifolia TaxID=60698 RepID=UPI001C4FBB91|nr:LOB domain-containing protein 16-like [Macadamia integrifolia]